MGELFDAYDKSYGTIVQSSIDFAGLPHSFFSRAKADALRELIAARLPGTQKPQMLDVGCGVGEIHPFLRGIFGRVCGADVSANSVAQARIRNPEVEYQAYAGETLPYESATFDIYQWRSASCITYCHRSGPDSCARCGGWSARAASSA